MSGREEPFARARRRYAERAFAEALEACLEVPPGSADHGEALHLGGVAAQALADLPRAEALLRGAVQADPGDPARRLHLGRILLARGRTGAAEAELSEAVRLDPGDPEARLHFGVLLRDAGRSEAAEAAFRAGLAAAPGHPALLGFLGLLLLGQGRRTEALPLLDEAARRQPRSPEAQFNLGKALDAAGRPGAAMERYAAALALRPDFVAARTNLAILQAGCGQVPEGLLNLREALAQAPDRWPTRSAYLFHLNHDPAMDGPALLAEHVRWSSAPEAPRLPPRPGGGRLRVGLVSPDFRRHSCAYFLEPLLRHLDREAVELFAYVDLAHRDEVTARLAGLCEHFVETTGLDTGAAVARLRADGLDVAVDLAGHSPDNRLPLFAARVAPLQATWLGYPGTTGLAAMDLRLTDAEADPPGFEAHHRERLLRLPRFLCYGPDPAAPPVTPPPCLASGRVTFGSFNNLSKLHDGVLRTWAQVLAAVPGSRLLLKGHRAFNDPLVRRRTLDRLAAAGFAEGSVTLLPLDADPAVHLARYGEVDVALDPFPYNGTTTTCEALWMGVPVVGLEGNRHAARVGRSLLRAVGLGGWIAPDPEAYVRLAATLASDPEGLAARRAGQRPWMAASPLCDGAAFARDFLGALGAATGREGPWT